MALAVLGILLPGSPALAAKHAKQNTQSTTQAKEPPAFAKVGKETISWMDYEYEYRKEVSAKFYHGKPTEAQLASFQREVGEQLVTNALLVQEAKRRKIKPDGDYVKQQLQQFEDRFKNDPKWPEARPRVLPVVTKRFEGESLRSKLEEAVRNVPVPDEKRLREYYAAHPDKFTTPPQPKVSVILLRMDPSSDETEWQKATEQANDLVKRLRAGGDFAEMARQYSGDVTADKGGDMGYLHGGMLPGLPEQIVNALKPGEISEPVRLLEGVAIFRLDDRLPSVTNSFDEVKQRVSDLLVKELSSKAWDTLIANLRKNAVIKIDESRFLKFSAADDKQDGTPKANNDQDKKN